MEVIKLVKPKISYNLANLVSEQNAQSLIIMKDPHGIGIYVLNYLILKVST